MVIAQAYGEAKEVITVTVSKSYLVKLFIFLNMGGSDQAAKSNGIFTIG